MIAAVNGAAAAPLWCIVMFFAAMAMISFPITRRMYSGGEVGRALSLLNFIIFLFSFLIQWLVGIVLDFYPVAGGHFSPEGHRVCVLAVALFNLACCAYFALGMKLGWLRRG